MMRRAFPAHSGLSRYNRAPPTAHSARRVSPAPAPRSQSSARRDTSPRRAKQTAPPALRATSARHDCTERLNAVPRATTHLSARSSASSAQRAPSAPTSPLASRRKSVQTAGSPAPEERPARPARLATTPLPRLASIVLMRHAVTARAAPRGTPASPTVFLCPVRRAASLRAGSSSARTVCQVSLPWARLRAAHAARQAASALRATCRHHRAPPAHSRAWELPTALLALRGSSPRETLAAACRAPRDISAWSCRRQSPVLLATSQTGQRRTAQSVRRATSRRGAATHCAPSAPRGLSVPKRARISRRRRFRAVRDLFHILVRKNATPAPPGATRAPTPPTASTALPDTFARRAWPIQSPALVAGCQLGPLDPALPASRAPTLRATPLPAPPAHPAPSAGTLRPNRRSALRVALLQVLHMSARPAQRGRTRTRGRGSACFALQAIDARTHRRRCPAIRAHSRLATAASAPSAPRENLQTPQAQHSAPLAPRDVGALWVLLRQCCARPALPRRSAQGTAHTAMPGHMHPSVGSVRVSSVPRGAIAPKARRSREFASQGLILRPGRKNVRRVPLAKFRMRGRPGALRAPRDSTALVGSGRSRVLRASTPLEARRSAQSVTRATTAQRTPLSQLLALRARHASTLLLAPSPVPWGSTPL